MGIDYYNILKVNRNASIDDLRKSYKRLAMIWHPDKNPTSRRAEAEAKFKQISEAFDVLSDPQKRQIYDLYGEEALKSGQFPPPSRAGGSSFRRDPGGGHGRRYEGNGTSFRNAEDIYAEIFGADGGGGGGVGSGGGGRRGGNRDGFYTTSSSGVGVGGSGGDARKGPAVENTLPCSLEDLYKGVKKKMKISRTICDAHGRSRTVEEILTIEIKPGWKKGTKITFPEKGNQEPGVIPADLIFVVDEKPHILYKRDGSDLVINHELTLLEALTGKNLEFNSLDGRNLVIPLTDIVKPGYEMIIPGEGMPISREPGRKGNLRIKFDVKYPARLTTEQKSDLRRVLGGIS
ncbi:hypothetical protein MLD38_031948 [Melastoma candidum]|uniref:Uncharacterized protein n=1 Tax=Melastoma candidum TaxID=119954 RepID=A0ACB9MT03_9MYRT|nr:hypothetical protein MLD38_031948 [Melastoma candidum]